MDNKLLKNLPSLQKGELVEAAMPLKHFAQNRVLLEELRTLVNSEGFKKGCAVLMDIHRPMSSMATSESSETNAKKLLWYLGYCDAFKDIQRLANPKTPKKNFIDPVMQQEWEDPTN